MAGSRTAPVNGQYDGTSFANSGIIGPDPGQAQSFDLTFICRYRLRKNATLAGRGREGTGSPGDW